ncbi:MAG: RNA polymerase sigma factor [Planctomycetota bacterium]
MSTDGQPPPNDLLQGASRGDERATTVLLTAYLERLRAYIRLRCGPAVRARESVSDLVQSVCRDILERGTKFEFRTEPEFRAYLFTTALNKVRMREREIGTLRRDVKREVNEDLTRVHDLEASIASPSRVAEAAEVADAVERALDELPDLEREVLTLSRIVGLPTAVIATQVGRAESSVRQILSRALVKLSRALDRDLR